MYCAKQKQKVEPWHLSGVLSAIVNGSRRRNTYSFEYGEIVSLEDDFSSNIISVSQSKDQEFSPQKYLIATD